MRAVILAAGVARRLAPLTDHTHKCLLPVFPDRFLRGLIDTPAPSALLLDRGFQDTGEEVKLYAVGESVIALGKKFVPEAWDVVGEGVGLLKCRRAHAR